MSLFYGEIILLTIEGYFEFIIAGYINSLSPNVKTILGVVSWLISYMCLILIITNNIMFIYALTRDEQVLLSAPFRRKFGKLYFDLREDSKLRLSAWFVFVLRRMLFCLVAFSLTSYP
jgi:hypothetical protein